MDDHTIVVKTIPEVFGVRALGAIMGVLSLAWRCGAALGPSTAGFIYDATGSYLIPFGAAPVAVVSWRDWPGVLSASPQESSRA